MANNDLSIHREEYLYLAGLTHDSALIAWGAFYFKLKGDPENGKWELIDDDDLDDFKTSRTNLIGASSAPYAASNTAAEVELTEQGTGNTKKKLIAGANHAVFEDLKPDTAYTYSVRVNGELWGAGPLRDWEVEGDKGFMRRSNFSYDNVFRTFPDPAQESPDLAFAILGDFGRGVRTRSEDGQCQREIAASLARAVEEHDVRLILSTGDNIYHGSKQGSGDEDDDWFFTFFQPYRFVINRVPVFPSVGNHDEGETVGESSDDRRQLYDNLYIRNRFVGAMETGDASLEPGMFYRVRYGSDIELICLDTSKQSWLFAERYFKHKNHQPFIESALPNDGGAAVKWRIPFFHHPPFCAGPNHLNKQSVIDYFVPKFIRAGVRAAFCGHEHNFQHSLDKGIHYFVTGGSGKFDSDKPRASRFDEARTQAWGGNEEGHFLLVEIKGNRMKVMPFGNLADETLRPIKINAVTGEQNVPPFEVEA
ncbi:MAG: metallophosphoesterase family protein [Rubrivivax sp.]|nr:metallophosphoesterase family protein [Pyrinomonadaceae bacterium]